MPSPRSLPALFAFLLAGGMVAQPCLVDYVITQSPLPTNGNYPCGQAVTFCCTITSWNTTSANWFHGITASFGPGWDQGTLTPGTPPATCGPSTGTWGWFNSVQGTAGTALPAQGPGFFFDLNADGNPGNNFGDFCNGVVNWQFCWTINVLSGPACVNGLDLAVNFNTFGDSETGSWGSSACTGDAIAPSQPAVILACAADAGTGGPLALCNTSAPVDLFAQLTGTPNPGGTWTGPGGTPFVGSLDPAIASSGNYTYTVGTVSPPCSASSVIAVAIAQQPDAGTDGSLTLCSSAPAASLSASLVGTPDPGGAWSSAQGASSGSFDPAIDAPGIYTYTITGTAPCVDASATVTVAVTPSPNAGGNGDLAVCSNSPVQDLFAQLTGAPSPGGSWTDPFNQATTGTFTPGSSAPGSYTYTVAGAAPCPNSSATVNVTLAQAPDAGADAATALCDAGGVVSLLSFLTGSPQSGGTWTGPSGGGVADALDPAGASSGDYTYTVNGNAPCLAAQAVLSLTIQPQLSAGSNAVVNFCEASDPTDLFALLGGTPSYNGTWLDPNGATVNSIIDPATSIPGDYTHVVPSAAPCVVSQAVVTVNINPQANAGADAARDVCSSDGAFPLFGDLGPNAQAGGTWTDATGAPFNGTFIPGTTTDGTFTYTITGSPPCPDASATVDVNTVAASEAGSGQPLALCSNGPPVDLSTSLAGTPDPGGAWTTPFGGASNGTIDPATAIAGAYTYTIAANAPCPAASTVVDVSISPAPDTGTDAVAQVCGTDPAVLLVGQLGGTPDPLGTWTGPDGLPHGALFDAASDPPGTYTYSIAGTPPCASSSSTVDMIVAQAAEAGIDGAASLCENDAASDPIQWLSGSPDAGGTWTSPSGATLTTLDPSTATNGAYTYTVSGMGPCPDDQSVVAITIDQLPEAGNDASVSLCADASDENLFLLLGSAQPGGTWNGPFGAASGTFQPGMDQPGAYTYTVLGVGACAGETDAAAVDVAVNPLPVPIFNFNSAAGCAPMVVRFTNLDPAAVTSALWSFGDGGTDSGVAGAVHSYIEAGSYDVTLEVADANGCVGSTSISNAITVSDGPDPGFYALPLRVSVNDPVTQVTHLPEAGVSYVWNIGTSTLDTSGIFALTLASVVGEYPICLTATDGLGCSATECISVVVDDELTIFVANAFTPNGDDINDWFRPSVIGVEEDWYRFLVFDRWGELVFSTDDPDQAWNGGMNNDGKPLPDGVYVWTLRAKDQFTTESAELVGTVTLLK